MLFCCNTDFRGVTRVIRFNNSCYRIIKFGTCPICGVAKYTEVRYSGYTDKKTFKTLKGNDAIKKMQQIKKKSEEIKHGTFSNQTFYYGDFKKTNRIDQNGIPIYLQLRKNLNGQSEILGTIETTLRVGEV